MFADNAVTVAGGTELSDVAGREVRVVVATLVQQVDHYLQLLQALKAGDFLRVFRLHQSLEGGVDQDCYTTVEGALFAEQVALGLVLDCTRRS